MRNIIYIIIAALTVNPLACQNAANGQNGIKKNIAVEEFAGKLSSVHELQLIDVRTPEEFAGGHLKGAVNIDINGADFDNKISQLDKSKTVLVYCLSGGRSARAASAMQDKGFKEVYNMEGGIMRWKAAGKPVEAGAGTTKVPGLTGAAFAQLTVQKQFVLVDFNAPWCEPCKKMMPMLDALSEKTKTELALVKINADDNKELLSSKNITEIPYLELYKDGKLVWSHSGLISEEDLVKETGL